MEVDLSSRFKIDLQEQIVLNFFPISMGGGLQNTLSFLRSLNVIGIPKSHFFAIVRYHSPLKDHVVKSGVEYYVVKSGNYPRLKFELKSRHLFPNNQTCFTHFGLPMLGAVGRCLNIVGCAYSNLFYPEVPFWSYLPLRERYLKYAIDEYRRYMLKKADYWIFETDTLKNRAIEICGFPEHRVGVVRMAPSELVSPEKVNKLFERKFEQVIPKAFRILFLSGPHPNKRLHFLGEIASAMSDMGLNDFVFVTTMDENHPYTEIVKRSFVKKGVDRHLVNLGPISPSNVASLINVCDAMGNFSVLESFSNNFVEAWQMRKPLIVTDADWSREACGNAAIYVNVENINETAEQIIMLANNSRLRADLIAYGYRQLGYYLTPEQKTMAYMEIIERARSLGPCLPDERESIHWPRSFWG